MDREIVIVTSTESHAYEALTALKQLDRDGSIELYANAVITKEGNGELSVKASEGDIRRGAGTMLGLSLGALIGLLAGPVGAVAGAAAMTGAAAGGMVGLSGELALTGIAGDFVRNVSNSLQPGSFALVASVWEDWTTPIDIAAAKVGGKVFRQGSHDVAKAQIHAAMQELDDEAAFVDKEIMEANEQDKANLRALREEIRVRQAEQRAKLQTRADELQKTADAKIAAVNAKASAAAAKSKARHVEHVNKLRRFASAQKASFAELFGSHPTR